MKGTWIIRCREEDGEYEDYNVEDQIYFYESFSHLSWNFFNVLDCENCDLDLMLETDSDSKGRKKYNRFNISIDYIMNGNSIILNTNAKITKLKEKNLMRELEKLDTNCIHPIISEGVLSIFTFLDVNFQTSSQLSNIIYEYLFDKSKINKLYYPLTRNSSTIK